MFIVLFLVCIVSLVDAAERQRKVLITCSDRSVKSDEAHFIHTIWQEDKALLSYSDKPYIITMDVKDSQSPTGKHIKADAATVVLSSVLEQSDIEDIDVLYVERPWTFDFNLAQTNTIEAININTVDLYMQNLLVQLPQSITVVIEWHPFTTSMQWYSGKEEIFQESPVFSSYQKINPFSGLFDTKLRLAATCIAIDKDVSQYYSKSFIQEATKMVPLIKNCIEFYKLQKIPYNGMKKKLQLETEILLLLSQYNGTIKKIKIPERFSCEISKFNQKVDHVGFEKNDGTIVYEKLIQKNIPVKKSPSYYTVQPNTVTVGTLFYFLWSDMTINLNKDAVLDYFSSLGLQNNSLQRVERGEYNNRTHIWQLRGHKPATT